MVNRRQFLYTTAGAALLAGSPRLFAAAKAPRRKPPFRVLFGNDTTNTVSCVSPWHKKGEPFRAGQLAASVDEVAGTGVDVHLLQPGLGWIPWWQSKVYPPQEHYRWFKERTGWDPDSFGKYVLAGGDLVKLFTERCRKRGQTPLISLRMNDAHHLEYVDEKTRNAVWASKLYVEHPEYRIGSDPKKTEQRVLNWAIPAVRAQKLAVIRRSVPQAAVFLEMCHSIWNGKKPPGKGYDIFPFRRATPEHYYTAARHFAYARGADGVSAFNFAYYREHGGPGRGPFAEPPFHVFKHLGDRNWLAKQPQHWFLASGWGCPFAKHRSVLPRKVEPGQTATFTLDLAPPAGGWKRVGRLRIQGDSSLSESRWTARLNGDPLTPTDDVSEPYPNPYPPMLGKPDEMRAWKVSAALLRDGPNKLEFVLDGSPRLTLAYLDLAIS